MFRFYVSKHFRTTVDKRLYVLIAYRVINKFLSQHVLLHNIFKTSFSLFITRILRFFEYDSKEDWR